MELAFQDAITPPISSKLAIGVYAAAVIVVVLGFVAFGFLWGVAHLAGFIVLMVLTQTLFPAVDSSHFYGIITTSMARRYVDYVRDRDHLRAEAMAELLERAGIPVPK